MKKSTGEWIFTIINYTLITAGALLAIYPFVYVLVASLSSGDAVTAGEVWLIPKGFQLGAYEEVFQLDSIWVSYGNALFYTVFGTMFSLVITICGAYTLSKKRLVGRRFFNYMVLFTMWFNPGMVPHYLNFKSLGLYNQRLAVIVAFAVLAFYVILMRTYFESIPDSLEEAASIDGASDLYILFKVYLPMAIPAIATISLYYAVIRWNGFLWSMILLRDSSKVPLQVWLKKLIVEMNMEAQDGVDMGQYNREVMIYATIVIAVLPMLALYPFIQRFFIKGIMVGAIKG